VVVEKLFNFLADELPADAALVVATTARSCAARAAELAHPADFHGLGEDSEGDFRLWLWDAESWTFNQRRGLLFLGRLGLIRSDHLPPAPLPVRAAAVAAACRDEDVRLRHLEERVARLQCCRPGTAQVNGSHSGSLAPPGPKAVDRAPAAVEAMLAVLR
jgi:hypothetical protein